MIILNILLINLLINLVINMFINLLIYIYSLLKYIYNLFNNNNNNNIYIKNNIIIASHKSDISCPTISYFVQNLRKFSTIYKYKFKNTIYIYLDIHSNKYYNIRKDNYGNTLNFDKYISNISKKDAAIIMKESGDKRDFREYHILEYNIDKNEFDKYLQNINPSIENLYNNIPESYYNNIINFDKSTKIHYDNFVNMFNNYDKNFIKIGVYGKSNIGKTFFLKNIIKILKQYNKCYLRDCHEQFIRYEKILKNKDPALIYFRISNYILLNDEDDVNILYLTTDNFDYFVLKYLSNNKLFGRIKTILMIETLEYNNYFDNFDIKFEPNFKI